MMNRDFVCFAFVIFLLTFATITLGDQCECGLERQNNRIFSGTKVTTYRYPWMALIRVRHGNSGSYSQCGGSLIDRQHILTAAHCVFKDNRLVNPSSVEVTLDVLNKDREYGTRIKGSQIFHEPTYRSSDPMGNDIAIIRLQQSVPLNNRISTVCLPATDDRPFQKLTVAGWGVLNSRDTRTSDLNEVQVDYLNQQQCERKRFEYLYQKNPLSTFLVGASQTAPIPDGDICAINQQTGGDACSGDSGGPLMHKNEQSGRWIQVGIVSGAWASCGIDKNIPGLYTSVAKHRNFIKTYANPCFRSYTDNSIGGTSNIIPNGASNGQSDQSGQSGQLGQSGWSGWSSWSTTARPTFNSRPSFSILPSPYNPHPSYNQYPGFSRPIQQWQPIAVGYNPSGLGGSYKVNDLDALTQLIEQLYVRQQNPLPTGMRIVL